MENFEQINNNDIITILLEGKDIYQDDKRHFSNLYLKKNTKDQTQIHYINGNTINSIKALQDSINNCIKPTQSGKAIRFIISTHGSEDGRLTISEKFKPELTDIINNLEFPCSTLFVITACHAGDKELISKIKLPNNKSLIYLQGKNVASIRFANENIAKLIEDNQLELTDTIKIVVGNSEHKISPFKFLENLELPENQKNVNEIIQETNQEIKKINDLITKDYNNLNLPKLSEIQNGSQFIEYVARLDFLRNKKDPKHLINLLEKAEMQQEEIDRLLVILKLYSSDSKKQIMKMLLKNYPDEVNESAAKIQNLISKEELESSLKNGRKDEESLNKLIKTAIDNNSFSAFIIFLDYCKENKIYTTDSMNHILEQKECNQSPLYAILSRMDETIKRMTCLGLAEDIIVKNKYNTQFLMDIALAIKEPFVFSKLVELVENKKDNNTAFSLITEAAITHNFGNAALTNKLINQYIHTFGDNLFEKGNHKTLEKLLKQNNDLYNLGGSSTKFNVDIEKFIDESISSKKSDELSVITSFVKKNGIVVSDSCYKKICENDSGYSLPPQQLRSSQYSANNPKANVNQSNTKKILSNLLQKQ